MFGFNCETFTSVCGNLVDKDDQGQEGEGKSTRQNPFQREVEKRVDWDRVHSSHPGARDSAAKSRLRIHIVVEPQKPSY